MLHRLVPSVPAQSAVNLPLVSFCLAMVLVLCSADVASGQYRRRSGQLPSFDVIEAAVERHFQLDENRMSDLVAQSEVEPVFKLLAMLGWEVADDKVILAQVLPDNDFLIRQSKTRAGQQFMQQIRAYPLGFDCLDHLARIPRGRQVVLDLIRGPDGYKMIEYLVTTGGGENMAAMLSSVPGGKKFNEPTGRIYTPQQLLERLRESYAEELKRREKAARRGQPSRG